MQNFKLFPFAKAPKLRVLNHLATILFENLNTEMHFDVSYTLSYNAFMHNNPLEVFQFIRWSQHALCERALSEHLRSIKFFKNFIFFKN